MNQDSSPTSAAPQEAAVVSPEASAALARRPRNFGPWLAAAALVLAVLALIMASLLWQKLDFTQKELARRSQDTANQSSDTRALALQAEGSTKELQARLAVAEVKLSEVSLQRSQLEELMLALSRSRDDNLVQDLESALRLAQQQTELTGSVQPLLAALQAADVRISRAAQPRLNPVQRAMARDAQRIRSMAVADVPSLVQRLDELVRRVDQWPVPNEVGPLANATRSKSNAPDKAKAGVPTNAIAKVAPVVNGPAPIDSAEPVLSKWDSLVSRWNGFWRRVWEETTRSGRELVRVSRIDRPEAVLLAPEQAFFLRENLKLRLLNARLGLLARQLEAVQDDLKNIDEALARHFDTSSPDVAAAQAVVTQLRAELTSTQLPQPDESLAALAVAAGGR
jgi:uroporphyrin-3 C-methyltransferase